MPHEFRVHGHFAEAVSNTECYLAPISPIGLGCRLHVFRSAHHMGQAQNPVGTVFVSESRVGAIHAHEEEL